MTRKRFVKLCRAGFTSYNMAHGTSTFPISRLYAAVRDSRALNYKEAYDVMSAMFNMWK